MALKHLTHNWGFTPWCGGGDVGYSLSIGSTLTPPDYWCPECVKVCLKKHKTTPPGPILKSCVGEIKQICSSENKNCLKGCKND